MQEAAAETTARDKAEEENRRERFIAWWELVQCQDKGSINFIRLTKPDRVAAWKGLEEKHGSTDVADPANYSEDEFW